MKQPAIDRKRVAEIPVQFFAGIIAQTAMRKILIVVEVRDFIDAVFICIIAVIIDHRLEIIIEVMTIIGEIIAFFQKIQSIVKFN